MDRRYNNRTSNTAENLEGSDTLSKASRDEVNAVFSFLGIDETPDSILDGETADLELWAQLDQEYSSDYATLVMSNETVEGVVELTADYGDKKETYQGRVEIGAQNIFSLNHMSNYEGNVSEEISIEKSYEENEEIEAD